MKIWSGNVRYTLITLQIINHCLNCQCLVHRRKINETTWVDQKALKLLAYLFEYTTELYKTYTEYSGTIS